MQAVGGRVYVASLPPPGPALRAGLEALHAALVDRRLATQARVFHLAAESAIDCTPLQFQCEAHPTERGAPPPLDALLRLAQSVQRWLADGADRVAVLSAHDLDRPHVAAAAVRMVSRTARSRAEAVAGLEAAMNASQRRYTAYLEALLAAGLQLHAPRLVLTAVRVDGAPTAAVVRLVVTDARGNLLYETEQQPRARQVFILFEMRVSLQADFRVALLHGDAPLAAASLHSHFAQKQETLALPFAELDCPPGASPLLAVELYLEAADAPAAPPQQRFQLSRQSRRIFRRPRLVPKEASSERRATERRTTERRASIADEGKRESRGGDRDSTKPREKERDGHHPRRSDGTGNSPASHSSAHERRHTVHERREKKAAEYARLHERSRTEAKLRKPAPPAAPALRESAPPDANETEKTRVELLRTALRPQQSHVWEIDASEVERGKQIAQGATAMVYRAKFRGQRVAVKEFTDDACAQGEALDSLRKEFAVISAIRAPNVMLFFGAVLRPRLAMVVELCERCVSLYVPCSPCTLMCVYAHNTKSVCDRGSLFDVLNDGAEKISWKRVLSAAADAAEGVACLHGWRPEIVHRDLKSLNLLVARNWTVKVGDFGTSRFTWSKEGALLSNLAKIRGTYVYTPPELFYGELFTTKGDVYALGIVLWELTTRLLAGRYFYPYYDSAAFARPFQILVQAATKAARPRLHPKLPPALAALIQACWHERPEQRPSAAELAKETRALQKAYKDQKEAWDALVPGAEADAAEGAGEPYADALVESSSDDSDSDSNNSSGASSSVSSASSAGAATSPRMQSASASSPRPSSRPSPSPRPSSSSPSSPSPSPGAPHRP